MGAYAHGRVVVVEGTRMLFLTGQIALDERGTCVGEDIGTQTRVVFAHVERLLRAGGASFEHLVKLLVFLTDMADRPAFSVVRDELLADVRPATTLVQVPALAHPDCLVEVDATAVVP